MTGWRRLITATVRLADRDGTRLQRRPADGRLLFEPVGETTSRSAERVRGIVTGAWALSAEICQACGGPGDPVTLGRGGRGTRCGDCREPSDRVLARPAWCRKRETGHEAPGLIEDLVGAQNLADLMEARHTPATYAGWPVRRSQGDPDMTIVCPIVRHGGQRMGMGAGLLARQLPRGAPERLAVDQRRQLRSPCVAPRFLGRRSDVPPFGRPRHGRCRRPGRRRRVPRGEDAGLVLDSLRLYLLGVGAGASQRSR